MGEWRWQWRRAWRPQQGGRAVGGYENGVPSSSARNGHAGGDGVASPVSWVRSLPARCRATHNTRASVACNEGVVGWGGAAWGGAHYCMYGTVQYMQMANRRWARLKNRLAKQRQEGWTEWVRRLKRALSQSDIGISSLLTSAKQHESSMLK